MPNTGNYTQLSKDNFNINKTLPLIKYSYKTTVHPYYTQNIKKYSVNTNMLQYKKQVQFIILTINWYSILYSTLFITSLNLRYISDVLITE